MMIDLAQLRTFVAVAEEEHLTRAAERLHMSMSAASAHVRAIEDQLSVQLFIRSNRNLELTRSGQVLLQRAKLLLGEASQFVALARELSGKVEGTLSIGSGSEPVAKLGEIIAALNIAHPLVSVNLHARASFSGRLAVKTGELDFAILLGGGPDSGLTLYELDNLRFRVVGPISLQTEIERADWEELAALPWITPVGSTAYTEMQRELFGERGLELNSVAHFDNAVLGRTMLHAGVGLMLVREDSAMRHVLDGTLAMSPIAHSQFQVYLAHQKSRAKDPLIDAFLQAAKQVWPAMSI